jgi:hypothetical protein
VRSNRVSSITPEYIGATNAIHKKDPDLHKPPSEDLVWSN